MTAREPQLGLFSSQLDPLQTNRGLPDVARQRSRPLSPSEKDFEKKAAREAWRLQPAEPEEVTFRHSGWADERRRVRDAMGAAGLPAARLERFDQCGANCVVEFSKKANRHRCRATYCGDRFCKPCCGARGHQVKRNVMKWLEGRSVRFVTLTLRHSKDSLWKCLARLIKSFSMLRDRIVWKDSVTGGVGLVEVKRGSNSDLWHPHLHVLCVGGWIDATALREAWHDITGDSWEVKVLAVNDHGRAADYVAKYATKGWTAEVARDRDSLIECLLALRGKRLCLTFGEFRKLEPESDVDAPDDWNRVGRLVDIRRAADRGEQWAIGVFVSLSGVTQRDRWAAESITDDPAA